MEFLKENPGTGKGDLATKYTYYVETLSDGRRVFLTRPGFLNKQFDFVINVEDVNFNKEKNGKVRTAPTHDDVFDDLKMKQTENPKRYEKFYSLIERIFQCEEVEKREHDALKFNGGYPVDLLLMVIKWYFIEQDIAYWNYSGRNMFMSGVPEP